MINIIKKNPTASVLEVWKPTESKPRCETLPSHASWVVFSTRDNPRAQEYKFGNI